MRYNEFAYYYDTLMSEFDYPAWAEYYIHLMKKTHIWKNTMSICDAACGTASMSIELSRMGHNVIGVDCSSDMLMAASQKIRKHGLKIPLINQDIRALSLHRESDAIVCSCDGINYLQTNDDLLAFFRSARNALRPNGGLFFDISSQYKLSRYIGNNIFGEDRKDVTYIWQNSYDENNSLLTMDIAFFVPMPNSLYRRFDERHVQRAYTIDEINHMLESSGFEIIGIFGEQTFQKPEDDAMRIHFAAIKR